MRGKAQAEQVRRFLNGITPAYAGKRTKSSRCPPRMWDHPRVCGEKNLCILRRVEIPGSPPRMRGKGVIISNGEGIVRITPAYAGKSETLRCNLGPAKDHPRVCGEKRKLTMVLAKKVGSPPRMRGKVIVAVQQQHRGGITPAYAGKSTQRA